MAMRILYRNVRAGDQLETFMVAAVSSILAIRSFLHFTGYPQVGGESLHIAHMLYGGLFMAAALIIALSFLGSRVRRLVAILGGVGFGFFIDELGKFITRDNDYFYEPTIGLIYATFIIIYLSIRFVGRIRPVTRTGYLLNALSELEEAAIGDFDPSEKDRVRELLKRSDPNNPLTRHLIRILDELDTIETPKRANPLRPLKDWTGRTYARFARDPATNRYIGWFFVLEAVLFVAAIIGVLYNTVDNVFDPLSSLSRLDFRLAVAELCSAGVAAAFTLLGAIRLPASRRLAYGWFMRATLVNIFLTEIFMFSRTQFEALPSFAFNLVLFILLRFALDYERRHSDAQPAKLAA